MRSILILFLFSNIFYYSSCVTCKNAYDEKLGRDVIEWTKFYRDKKFAIYESANGRIDTFSVETHRDNEPDYGECRILSEFEQISLKYRENRNPFFVAKVSATNGLKIAFDTLASESSFKFDLYKDTLFFRAYRKECWDIEYVHNPGLRSINLTCKTVCAGCRGDSVLSCEYTTKGLTRYTDINGTTWKLIAYLK